MSQRQIEVRFPPHLRRFIDVPEVYFLAGKTVREVVDQLEVEYPGVASYLLHENGNMRQHVNIFLGDKLISDRISLSDPLDGVDQITIMQALSGG